MGREGLGFTWVGSHEAGPERRGREPLGEGRGELGLEGPEEDRIVDADPLVARPAIVDAVELEDAAVEAIGMIGIVGLRRHVAEQVGRDRDDVGLGHPVVDELLVEALGHQLEQLLVLAPFDVLAVRGIPSHGWTTISSRSCPS